MLKRLSLLLVILLTCSSGCATATTNTLPSAFLQELLKLAGNVDAIKLQVHIETDQPGTARAMCLRITRDFGFDCEIKQGKLIEALTTVKQLPQNYSAFLDELAVSKPKTSAWIIDSSLHFPHQPMEFKFTIKANPTGEAPAP